MLSIRCLSKRSRQKASRCVEQILLYTSYQQNKVWLNEKYDSVLNMSTSYHANEYDTRKYYIYITGNKKAKLTQR